MEQLTHTLPPLHHREVVALAHFGLELPTEKLDTILALPRATIIEDLEALVRHGLDLMMQDAIDEDENYFVFHSLMLLGHLQSEQSLPLVFEVFRLPEDDLDFLFGDMFLEDVWQVPLLCGLNQLGQLADFIQDDTIEWEFARINMEEALTQVAFHFPERKEEVLGHIARLLHHFNDLEEFDPESEVADVVASLTDAAANLDARDLLPVIESLFEKDRVDLMSRGDWEEFQQEWGDLYGAKRSLYPDVRDWYQTEGAKWLDMVRKNELEEIRREEERGRRQLATQKAKQHISTQAEKIGRNDPCFCGSGKKYKKCHGA